MSTQNPDITATNIVEKLQQQVQLYPKEPIYLIDYGNNYCFFEVLVNDIPVYKQFQYMEGSSFDANLAIFKSGTQKVSFRMFPAKYDQENNAEATNIFLDRTYLELNPEVYDKTSKGSFASPIKKYKTPSIPNPIQDVFPDSIFIAAGKDYYEGSFSFEAEVPYQLEAFEKAQDLRKMDRKELETKLLKKYNEIKSFYQNRDYDNIARVSFDKLKNELISLYYTKEDAKEMWETILPVLSNSTLEMQPIENYELKFFAEGKLIALITKSKEPILRGSSALWGKFKENGEERAFTSNDFFYIPEGETEFKVY